MGNATDALSRVGMNASFTDDYPVDEYPSIYDYNMTNLSTPSAWDWDPTWNTSGRSPFGNDMYDNSSWYENTTFGNERDYTRYEDSYYNYTEDLGLIQSAGGSNAPNLLNYATYN